MRMTTILVLSLTLLGAETRHKRIVDEADIKQRVGAHIERSPAVEVHLISAEIVTGSGATVTPNAMELFGDAAKTRSTRLIPVHDIHQIHYLRRYRSDSVLGGVLGATAGILIGGTAAYAIGSGGHDRAAAVALGTAPLAGAVVGVRRSREKQWTKITVRH
jgi:outer membrane lipoprotein SlyB